MDNPIISIEPHAQVVHAVVMKTALDERAAKQLEEEVSAAATAHPGLPVVLDMVKVRFAPSVALGALAQLWKGLNLVGRPLALIRVSHQLRGILSVTRLDSLMGIYGSLEEALPKLQKK